MSDSNNQNKRKYTEQELKIMRQRRDLAVKKRLQALREASSEEKDDIFIKKSDEKVDLRPKTFVGKLQNYWYHHSFGTVIGAICLSILVLFVYEMATKEKFDLVIPIVNGVAHHDEEIQEIIDRIEPLTKNPDGDGNANIDYSLIPLDLDHRFNVDSQNYLTSQTEFFSIIESTSSFLFIMDEAVYKSVATEGIKFVDLSKLSDNENIHRDKFYIENSSLFEGIQHPDKLFIVVRDIETSSKKGKSKYQEQFEYEKTIAEAIMNYQD